MSKIGKKLIALPSGVQAQFQAGMLIVKGPKGQLEKRIPDFLLVKINPDSLLVSPVDQAGDVSVHWGLYRSLVRNMVIGVSEGFKATLEFQGVGYKASANGNKLELSLGYSHPVSYKAPEGISFTVDKTSIAVSGIDKEMVGQVAAEIRSKRMPEPYKGSGIRYSDEIIKRKAGKKAIAAG